MHTGPLTSLIAQHLGTPGLRILTSPEWSSSTPGSRSRVRMAIAAIAGPDATLLDLSITPFPRDHSVSISHHRESGGFAVLPSSEVRIGFDMELRSRALPRLVARVCENPSELEEAPDACALFSAKEAAFKSLYRRNQPRGLKDITLSGWREIEPGIFACEAAALPERPRGVVAIEARECWAVFITRPEPAAPKEAECVGF